MIDFGLLVSIVVAVGVPALLVHWWPLTTYGDAVGFVDVAIGPAFAGLAVGRLAAVTLDDPASLNSIPDLLIVRSGVEFWPGVAAATLAVLWAARRSGVPPLDRLADMVPLSMIGYAGYEAACLFRDGCFGPHTAIGLRPAGLSTTMLPIGLLMGVGTVGAAVAVRSLRARRWPGSVVVLAGGVGVATVRAVGSFWLPHVGTGLTRQHLASIAVAVVGSVGLFFAVTLAPRQRSSQPSAPV